MTADIIRAIEAIHNAPPRLVYVFAGAGALALHWLHAVAGSSRTVLEARDCYAPRSLHEVVAVAPVQAVNSAVAEAMARWSLARAALLAEGEWPLLGVGCTAAIATDRTRRGADRAFVAVCRNNTTHTYALVLSKQRRRDQQELLVSQLIILAIANACNTSAPQISLDADETLTET